MCCSSAKSVRAINDSPNDLPVFLNSISSNANFGDNYCVKIKLNNKLVQFQLDTGADATAIPIKTFKELLSTPLSPSDKVLYGSNRAKLNVVGYFTGILQSRQHQTKQTGYVLRDVRQPLLGPHAIDALHVLQHVAAVGTYKDPRVTHADLFTDPGFMAGEYSI